MQDKETAVKDPVCGMDGNPIATGALKTQYAGQTYNFCREKCTKGFEANPGKYVHEKMAAQAVNSSEHH